MTAYLNALYTRAKEQIDYIDRDLRDHNSLSRHFYSRIHSLATAIIEGFGALVGALTLIPKAIAFLVGGILYLPQRVWNFVSTLSQGLRDYSSDFGDTLSKTARLAAGSLSSSILGFIHPPANSRVHSKFIFAV